MSPWAALRAELTLWRERGLRLPIWWRDDDATAPGPALDRLAAQAREVGIPVHLAVIPGAADAALPGRISAEQSLIPVVHGWLHHNHAPPGEKKAEYGAHRPGAEIETELQRARDRMQGLFGDRLCPVFVPPWNRIAPEVVPRVAGAGFAAISTYQPRGAPQAVPGLLQVNTHIDPINWRGDRGLVPEADLVAQTVALLQDRRAGRSDAQEPLGLLTHHLVHDAAIWDFTARWLAEMRAGPVAVWRLPAVN